MSDSGLVAMTRRRGAPALHEILTAPCGDGGSGRRKTAATLAFAALRAVRRVARESPGAALSVIAEPTILAALDGTAGRAKAELEDRLGWKLTLVPGEFSEARGYDVVVEQPAADKG
jgi:Ribonuclease G/E